MNTLSKMTALALLLGVLPFARKNARLGAQ